jgi:hypothetical protein
MELFITIGLIVAYLVYSYWPKKTVVNTCGNHILQKDDVINITGTSMDGKYRVVKVDGEQLTIKPRNWFG